MISGEGHKGDGQYRLLRNIPPFILIDHGQDLPIVGCTHRDHHAAAGPELLKQGGWNNAEKRPRAMAGLTVFNLVLLEW